MSSSPLTNQTQVAPLHRGLLITAAISSTLLIAMGGILCVTHFIRTCPDWPGCFGRIVPPAQTGAILEYTHRLLAVISGTLILAVAIASLVRTPRLGWLVIPPWIAVLLLIEVSYFGARVVLRGIPAGWAAVDVGSALLVVALMVASAVIGLAIDQNPAMCIKFSYKNRIGGLAIAATVVVYLVLISGVLVAGNNSITACLGWPIYSLGLLQADLHTFANTDRWVLSLSGIVLIVALVVQSWQVRMVRPAVYKLGRWVGILFVIETLLQTLLLIFNLPEVLLIPYTVTMAVFWAILVALLVRIGLETSTT